MADGRVGNKVKYNNILLLHNTKESVVNSTEKISVTHKNQNLRNYGIGWYFQKERDEKYLLAKIQPVSANWRGDVSTSVL